MGIRLKLTLFLLLFGFMILGAILWSNQFVLHKTMLHYVDQRDQQRLDRLQNNVEFFLDYELMNNVHDIPPQIWSALVHLSGRIELKQNPEIMPFILNRRPPPRPGPPDEFITRVTLVDASGQVVFGDALNKTCSSMPVVVDGKQVGRIGFHPLQELIDAADIKFAQSQVKLLSIGAVLITLVSLILLWPLANHFLIPIRQLTQAMHALATGDLKRRLQTNRKDELGELQQDFNHLATTLEAAQNSRNQWVADISHELRTPLTVINGSIEAMNDGVRPLNKDNLQALQKEVALLMRLIEDLYQLSLSDVGALQYSMTSLDFAALVEESYAQFASKAEAKGLNFSLDISIKPAPIKGDATRLLQLLRNLIQNAINYTDARSPQGEKGQIQMLLQKHQQHFVLTVQDSAPGVNSEEFDNLSERFYRSEKSRNRSTGGAGLGLAMVSQIVQAHQGELVFRQSSLGGLQVSVKLPLLIS